MRARFSFLLPDGELTVEQQEAIENLKDSLRGNDTISIGNAEDEEEGPEGIILDVTLERRTGHTTSNPIFSYLVVNKELPVVKEITGDTLQEAGVTFEDGTEVWLESLMGDPQEVFIAGYGTTSDEAWRQALEFLLPYQ
jgi:hypothetical protein